MTFTSAVRTLVKVFTDLMYLYVRTNSKAFFIKGTQAGPCFGGLIRKMVGGHSFLDL